MPIWEVDLFIDGPISVKRQLNLNVAKGFRLVDQFYSDVELRKSGSGVFAIVTARADTQRLARKAALFFFGQMLDVLAVQTTQPLYISLIESQSVRSVRHTTHFTDMKNSLNAISLTALVRTDQRRLSFLWSKGAGKVRDSPCDTKQDVSLL